MAGRMDRYVASAVLTAYAAALTFLVFMFTVLDVLFEMEEYMQVANERGVGILSLIGMLAEYQLLGIPSLFVQIAPFVTVIASMFALSRLMAANEVSPMVFTGRSMFRILNPLLAVGLLSALAMGLAWQTVIPFVAERHEKLRSTLLGRDGEITHKQITLRSKKNPRLELYCKSYRHSRLQMEGLILYDRGSSREDGIYVEAESAEWDPEIKDWKLTKGRRKVGDIFRPKEFLGMEGLTPNLIVDSAKMSKESSGLSYSELQALMELRPGKKDYRLAFHHHFTFPLANIVLLMLALPFAVHFEQQRRIERIALAILICAGYLVVDLTCQNLGYKAYLHPVVAAWIPTILFGSLGVVVYGGMRT